MFISIQLSSSYYVYQVAKKLKGAEDILQAMGYEKIGGSREAQELKYNGDVDSIKIAETAADLVILDGELERIKSLVVYAQDEHIPIILTVILQVRSHPTSIYTEAKWPLYQHLPQQGHLPVQGQPPPPRAQGSQQQQYTNPPPQQHAPSQNIPSQWQQQQQPRSMQPPRQASYSDVRRGSAPNHQCTPNVGQQEREEVNQEPIESYQRNLPLFEQMYANVRGKNKRGGIDKEVSYTPRTPFSPPNPNDFPEPIVHSQSELERLHLFGGDDGPCSMVDARSEPAGYNIDEYSLASTVGSPEYNAEFNKRAEDAWKIETPTQEQAPPHVIIDNPVPNVAVRPEKQIVVPAVRPEKQIVVPAVYKEEQIVDPAVNKEEQIDPKDDGLVTQDWLNENTSEDPYGYVNIGQSKDYKKYDKPAPEVKQKTVSETLHQQTNEPLPNLPTLDTPEPATRVQANDWQRNTYDYENRSVGLKPTAKPRNKLGVEKCATHSHLPTVTIETPYKSHTSPLSSLEHQSLSSGSESFLSAHSQYPTSNTDTMPDKSKSEERDRKDDYENVSFSSSTHEMFSTTYEYDPSEPSPSHPPDSLSPRTRRRSPALSKGSPTTSASSVVGTISPAEAVSKNHLKKLHSLSSVEGRDRLNTHTNLDKGLRPAPATQPLQIIPPPIDGTWTCDYCTNIMFDSCIEVCDVCGNKCIGTLV